jgi:hypothetical protein
MNVRPWGALDIARMNIGTEHVAHPKGEARVLVIEKAEGG